MPIVCHAESLPPTLEGQKSRLIELFESKNYLQTGFHGALAIPISYPINARRFRPEVQVQLGPLASQEMLASWLRILAFFAGTLGLLSMARMRDRNAEGVYYTEAVCHV